MPIPAVPNYLGSTFEDASPGLRFGLYLPIWTGEEDRRDEEWQRAQSRSQSPSQKQTATLWTRSDAGAKAAWRKITALTDRDRKTMAALAERQKALLPAVGVLSLDAIAVSPFTTGLGNAHPLENGFAFLNPYGLPYLPGSGVKGVLRQAARELASGEWGDALGWTEAAIQILFGLESDDGDTAHRRGALAFWDVIPQVHGDRLAVDIMTPHQAHYYQKKTDRKAGGSLNPHDSGQPNPISFLTVPPRSRFAFHVVCDLAFLKANAPELAAGDRWKQLLQAAFAHAYEWLGFGAKTAVGYGAFEEDPEARKRAEDAEKKRVAAASERARQEELAQLSPNRRRIRELRVECEARLGEIYNPNARENANGQYHLKLARLAKDAASPSWAPEEKRAAADLVEEFLPKLVKVEMPDQRKKLGLAALRGN